MLRRAVRSLSSDPHGAWVTIVTMSTERTLIVIPTYQESANVEVLLRRIRVVIPQADVLVVDDASPDGTADIVDALGRELGGISALRRPGKEGLGTAYRAGFAYGIDHGYDVLLQMDADLSHDPAALPAFVRELRRGADLVVGSRYIPGGDIPQWSSGRRALSRLGNRYARAMLAIGTSDVTSGFRGYRASMLETADFSSTRATGFGFQIELAYRVARAGGRITEIPITFSDRLHGESKMSARITAEALSLVTWWAVRDRGLPHRRPEPVSLPDDSIRVAA